MDILDSILLKDGAIMFHFVKYGKKILSVWSKIWKTYAFISASNNNELWILKIEESQVKSQTLSIVTIACILKIIKQWFKKRRILKKFAVFYFIKSSWHDGFML